jgi:SWIM zinc finger
VGWWGWYWWEMVSRLGDVFAARVVEALAEARVHGRGVRYFEDGHVVHEAGGDERVRAVVKGTVPYVVELWVEGGGPAWSCTCPAAEDGAFCKHCVAVSLTLAPEPGERPRLRIVTNDDDDNDDGGNGDGDTGDDTGDRDDARPDLETYVSGLPHERLIEIVLGQALMDRRLYKRLMAEAEAPTVGGVVGP